MRSFREFLSEMVKHLPGPFRIPREAMPQIAHEHYDELFAYLKEFGISIRKEKIDPRVIKPIQKSINMTAVSVLVQKGKASLKKPVLISKDNFLLDGHHRWAALKGLGVDSIDAIKIQIPAKEAIAYLRSFEKTEFRGIATDQNRINAL